MSEKYPMNNYVPTQTTDVYDLHTRLNKMKYDKILSNLDNHFKKCYITNFDLIHNECRGDKLSHSRRFYETVFFDRMIENLSEEERRKFVASAIKSEREDLYLEKKVIAEHFKKREELESRGIYLSSMRKKFYFKRTDDCKSIKLKKKKHNATHNLMKNEIHYNDDTTTVSNILVVAIIACAFCSNTFLGFSTRILLV